MVTKSTTVLAVIAQLAQAGDWGPTLNSTSIDEQIHSTPRIIPNCLANSLRNCFIAALLIPVEVKQCHRPHFRDHAARTKRSIKLEPLTDAEINP